MTMNYKGRVVGPFSCRQHTLGLPCEEASVDLLPQKDASLPAALRTLGHLPGLRVYIVCDCRQHRPQKGGICVANHTSPIDVLILTTDGCYAMVRTAH